MSIPCLGRFAAVLVFLLWGAACSLRRTPPPGADGAEIYRLQNCANCHGGAREGTHHGPALDGLRAHWERDRLAEFLADPAAFAAHDARLEGMDRQYGGVTMGRYDNLDLAQRSTLAEWLLAAGDSRSGESQ